MTLEEVLLAFREGHSIRRKAWCTTDHLNISEVEPMAIGPADFIAQDWEIVNYKFTHKAMLRTKCGCTKYVACQSIPKPLGSEYIVPLMVFKHGSLVANTSTEGATLSYLRRFKCFSPPRREGNDTLIWEYEEVESFYEESK